MIRLRATEKRFARAAPPVLRDLDLELAAGEFVALLGPSGAGKTTILRMLSGLDPDFDGELLAESDATRIGYLFQEARLMPWLTALENVALVVDGDRERAAAALESVGLAEALGRYPHQLSGGMQRRVALARAVVHRPQLMLLDEPFVSLDRPNAEQLHELLLAYWEDATPTVVLVSHDLDEALLLADRLVFLGGCPATPVLDQPVALERPRRPGSRAIAERREALLEANPSLLSGSAGLSS